MNEHDPAAFTTGQSQRRTFPDASNIRSIQYWPETDYLITVFKSGAAYGYEKVPNRVWVALKTELRIGTVFNNLIRTRHYTYHRLDAWAPEDEDMPEVEMEAGPPPRFTCPKCGSNGGVKALGLWVCTYCGDGREKVTLARARMRALIGRSRRKQKQESRV